MRIDDHEKVYASLFTFSLIIFLINFLIQGRIVFTYSDFYGLIFKLNWPFWLGYFILLVLISFHFSKFAKLDERFVFLTISLLVIYLIGTPFFLEHLPRFEDSWIHSYLPQQIFRNEKVNLAITVYEEYPGSFLFYGLLFQLLPPYHVMKFFPPLFYIVGVSTIYLIAKNLVGGRIAFLTSILYVFFNWTIEDNHISPQFLILALYFLFMLILVKHLNEKKWKMRYFLVLAFIALVINFSHPLTPIFLIFILSAAVVLCKKLRKMIIPVLAVVMVIFVLYELFETTAFFPIFNFVKNFMEILTFGHFSNPTVRFTGMGLLHRRVILGSKISITLFSVALGFFGIKTLNKEKFKTEAKFFFSWAFALLPLMLFLSQVIEGEFYERFALISSLPLAFLSSYFFDKSRTKAVYILIILLALTPLYFFAKHGNEAYQSESLEKLKADCYAFTFGSNCEENMEIVISSLDFDIDLLGIRHVGIVREEVMAISISRNLDVEKVFDLFDAQTEINRMDRYYSTNKAAVYNFLE